MKHQQGHSRAGSNRQLESITKSQAFGGAFPLQKKNIFFSFYLTKAELLALTPADFDFKKQIVTISKTFHRSKGKDVITSPKTVKSNRTIKMPYSLCEEIQNYIHMLYDIKSDERLQNLTLVMKWIEEQNRQE